MSLDEKKYFYASTEGIYCKEMVSINDFNKEQKFRVITSSKFGASKALELKFKGYTVAYLFKKKEYQVDFLQSINILKKAS